MYQERRRNFLCYFHEAAIDVVCGQPATHTPFTLSLFSGPPLQVYSLFQLYLSYISLILINFFLKNISIYKFVFIEAKHIS